MSLLQLTPRGLASLRPVRCPGLGVAYLWLVHGLSSRARIVLPVCRFDPVRQICSISLHTEGENMVMWSRVAVYPT